MILFNLDRLRLTLDLNPCNLNQGIPGLTARALSYGIDLRQKKDAVIFVARNRKQVKVVAYDHVGPFMSTRKIDKGCFQQLLDRVLGNGLTELTLSELLMFLDGECIMVRP